jgi:hypothetical protein
MVMLLFLPFSAIAGILYGGEKRVNQRDRREKS